MHSTPARTSIPPALESLLAGDSRATNPSSHRPPPSLPLPAATRDGRQRSRAAAGEGGGEVPAAPHLVGSFGTTGRRPWMGRRRRPRPTGGAAGVGWPSRSRGRRWLLAAWSASAAAPDLDPGGLLRPHPSTPAADPAVSGSRASGRPVDMVGEDLGGRKPPGRPRRQQWLCPRFPS